MKTIKEYLIFKNKYAEIYNNEIIDFEGKKGTHIIYGKVGENEQDGVSILPVNDKGDVLIFREYRYGIQDYIYSIPTGSVEKDLTVFENAKKELLEESGLVSENWESLDLDIKSDPVVKNVNLHYFIARDCRRCKNNDVEKDTTESFKGYEWLDVNHLVHQINSGEKQFNLISLPIIYYYYISQLRKQV